MGEAWTVAWSHGHMTVHARSGMIGATRLLLEDGRWVAPFYEAPWVGESAPDDVSLLANLRGEFACLPFGRAYGDGDGLPDRWLLAAKTPIDDMDGELTGSDLLPHGLCSNARWSLVTQSPGNLVIAIEYPQPSPIGRLVRKVQGLPGEAAFKISVEVEARRPCRRPFGFHPNFALPGKPGSYRIVPGRFSFGMTHPVGEADVSAAQPDENFDNLSRVPVRDGGTRPFDLLPLADNTEEIRSSAAQGALLSFSTMRSEHAGR